MTIRVAVVIPWRETPSRIPLKEYVQAWYSQNLPDATLVYSDSGHEIFNLSASRNLGAEKVLDYDVIIHNDADTIPNKESLIEGIKQTYESGYFCNPYDNYRMLDPESTRGVLDGLTSLEDATHEYIAGACSGIVITTPKTWGILNGFDENFKGWGYEDAAISAAHSVLMEKDFLVISGPAYAMSHAVAEKRTDLLVRNKERVDQYLLAMVNKDKDLAIKLTKENKMSRIKLAITVPTRGRPHNLARLAKALKNTCTVEYTLLARLDDDDKFKYPELVNTEYIVGPRIFFAPSLNELAEIAVNEGFTHIAILGDDVLPETKGWDKMMIDALPGLGVVYGSDGLEHLHGEDLPTHVIVPTEMYVRLGWLGLPTLRHLFCDNVWRELGKLTNFIYVPEAKLTHLHRWNKTAPNDNTYREANDKQKREDDRLAFETWRDGPGLEEARRLLS